MIRTCSVCGSTIFHIRAIDGLLICSNGHIIHIWNGHQFIPVVI